MENGGPPSDAAAGEAGTKQPGIRWERFLPRRSLRVLLVEHDDSTRHIVTALLRKCSYHVAAVADGMKAWEALREKNYHFDLVLAEVAMPSFSGIGLLSKIMGAEECKHIPVIMMSSHDSVGVVLKCMLKGAVDFLVKPVRKNELRNLWQHVWRKHCSSSSGNVSDNHAASNHFSANGSDKSQTGENSEEGNNAQSSGSMPEVDAQRDEDMEPFQVGGGGHKDEVETKPEQVEHLMTVGCNGQIRDESVGIVAKVTQTVQDSPLAGDGQKPPGSYKPLLSAEVALGPTGFKEVVNVDPGSSIQYYSVNGPSQGLNGFLEAIMSSKAHPAVVENCGSQKSSLRMDAYGISSPPHLELSLRRPQLNGCLRQDFKERNILKQSITSAFSRYGEKKVHPSTINISSDLCNKANKHTDRCTSDPSSGGIHNEQTFSLFSKEKVPSSQVNAGEALIQFPVSSDNKYGTGTLSVDPMRGDASVGCSSTGEDTAIHHPELGFMSHSIPMGAIPYHTLCTGYNTILQPVFYRETSLSPHGSTAIDVAVPISSDQSNHHGNRCTNDLACMKFHHNEESHHPYHLRQPSNMEHGEWGALSSIYLDQANQIGNCSQNVINQSGSNGSGDTIDAVMSTGNVFESGNESGQNCNSKDLECDRSRRAAALIKFRLKRKDRCFEKKVRYYSRKKLAEQRPRVKGQFVRQKTVESAAATDADK